MNGRVGKQDEGYMAVRLGVTGGIGSGKSFVCRILSEKLDIPVYNCDIHARIITLTDWDVMEGLMALDGGFYNEAGELDKLRLAQYMFASTENYQRINQLIHPAVRRDLREWVARQDSGVVAVESAILYESHFETEVDFVLLVDAPVEMRIQRAMRRDGATREQIEQRMTRQDTSLARNRADFVISNDGTTDLETELKLLIEKLC